MPGEAGNMRTLFFCLIAIATLASTGNGQTPIPVIVPAMTPAPAQTPVAAAVKTASTQTTLAALQAIKAANDEILKQQAATLIKLDEVEKVANEIRIYSKRG
jgi:hypothetical protein